MSDLANYSVVSELSTRPSVLVDRLSNSREHGSFDKPFGFGVRREPRFDLVAKNIVIAGAFMQKLAPPFGFSLKTEEKPL